MKRKLLFILSFFACLCLISCLNSCSCSKRKNDHSHSYEWEVTKEATCEENGVRTGVCSCGDKITEAIPASHQITWATITQATCKSDGIRSGICQCGKTFLETIKGEHKFKELEVTTCGEEGSYKISICTACEAVQYDEENVIHPHSWEKLERTEPTCEVDGELGYKCTDCGYKAVVDIDKLGHQPGLTAFQYDAAVHSFNCQRQGCEKENCSFAEHVFDDYVITKNSTCTENGEAEAFCTACGYHKTVVIQAGHKWSDWELTNNPNVPCESKRYCRLCDLTETDEIHIPGESAVLSFPDNVDCCVASFMCTRCEKTLENEKLHHSWQTTSHRSATCIKEGYKNQKCSYCGDTRVVFDNPYGHDTDWDYNTNEHWKTCNDCGYVIFAHEAHSFDVQTGSTYNEATGAYSYYIINKCTACPYQENYFENSKNPGDGENPENPSDDEDPENPGDGVGPNPTNPINPVVDHIHPDGELFNKDSLPTCTEAGYFPGLKCPDCDEVFFESEPLDPLGHNFVSSICSRCGECELQLELSSDGAYYIVTGVGAFEGGALTIPAMYNDKYVMEIADDAFNGNTAITSVKILDSVTKIGARAFKNCTSITYIRIGEAVKNIGSYAFYGCEAVKQIDYMAVSIDPSNDTDDDEQEVGSNAFTSIGADYQFTDDDVLFVIGKDVTTIPPYLFGDNSLLGNRDNRSFIKTIVFEEGTKCTKIGSYAFSGCNSLVDVIYNASLAQWCSITFGSESAYDSVMYLGNEYASPMYYGEHFYVEGDEIINVTIPSTISHISSYAFVGFDYLTDLVITSNITSIGEKIVANCNALNSITFGSSLKELCDLGNEKLINVYYTGTLSDWLSIEYESSKDNPMYYAEHLYIGGNLVTEVVVPSDITEIKAFAFYGVEELKKITIHNKVTGFGARAFGLCAQLNDVYYDGTVAEWMNITFGSTLETKSFTITETIGTNAPHNHFTGQAVSSSKSLSAIKGTGLSSLERMASSYSVTSIDEYYTTVGESEYLYNATIGGGSVFYPGIGQITTNVWVGEQANPLTYANNFYISGQKATDIVIPEGVSSIPSYALAGYKGLKSITIPSSVASIGGSAFEGCENLESVYYNGTAEGWLSIEFLKVELKQGGSVENDGFATIIGPSLIVYEPIGDLSYANPLCYAEKFYIGNELATDIVVPESITQIKHYAFYGYKGLKSITLHSGVCYIGEESFFECENLESVYFNGSIEGWLKIKYTLSDFYNGIAFTVPSILYNGLNHSNPLQYADKFYINGELATDIVIPETISKINNYVFYGYDGFKSITLPASITSIGTDAFYGAESLENIYYLGDIADWCNISFSTSGNDGSNPIRYTDYFYIGDELLTDLVIPIDTINIEFISFYGYEGLKSVTLHNSVLSINAEAFYGCEGIENVYYQGYLSDWFNIRFEGKHSNPASYAEHFYINGSELTNLVIPSTITEINQYAFYDCDFITSLTIPESVATINSYAFFGCDGLGAVIIPDTVDTIHSYAFGDCANIVIYCELAGKPTNWKDCWACSDRNTTTPCWYSESQPTDTDKNHYYWHYVDGEIVVWDGKEVPKGYHSQESGWIIGGDFDGIVTVKPGLETGTIILPGTSYVEGTN